MFGNRVSEPGHSISMQHWPFLKFNNVHMSIRKISFATGVAIAPWTLDPSTDITYLTWAICYKILHWCIHITGKTHIFQCLVKPFRKHLNYNGILSIKAAQTTPATCPNQILHRTLLLGSIIIQTMFESSLFFCKYCLIIIIPVSSIYQYFC